MAHDLRNGPLTFSPIDGAFGARRAAGEHYCSDRIIAANIYDELMIIGSSSSGVRVLRNCWMVAIFFIFSQDYSEISLFGHL